MTELEHEVLCIINEVTENCYTGKLKVLVTPPERHRCDSNCTPLNDTIYELYLYLDRWRTPIVLSYEGTEDEFKKFIRNEFKKNKYEKVHFYKITREPLVPPKEENDWDNE
jgi:hypothetical protein